MTEHLIEPDITYDAAYYADYFGGLAYTRDEQHWVDFFDAVASKLVSNLHPKTALDAGCAHGFLVEALRNHGVEASGFDISEYAIGQMVPKYAQHVRIGSLLEPIDGRYDVISCIEVIEHLPASDARLAVKHLTEAADAVLFSSTPYDHEEPTHLNVRPPEYWASLFAEVGYIRDERDDATFLAPWAVIFRRSVQLDTPHIVERFEREVWRLTEERNRLRRAINEQGSGPSTGNAELQRAVESQSADIQRLNAALVESRQALLVARDAAIGADQQAGHARAEAAELLSQLQAAQNQLELVNGMGAELSRIKNGKAMRLAEKLSAAANRARRVR